MKAAVFTKPNSPLCIISKAIPTPQSGELLVKISAVSICASDFMPWKGFHGDVEGRTAGHEGVGVVVEINGPTTRFSIGDKVGFCNSTRACNSCEVCQVGHKQFCREGKVNQGFDIDGFFAEYAVVGIDFAVRIPDGLPLERLAPLFCAGITAFRAVKQLESPARGTIGVFGLGGVGIFAMQFARALGFDVFGFDVSEPARAYAERHGATATFDSASPTLPVNVSEANNGRLLDGAIVAAGVPAAYSAAFQLTAMLKTIVAVGVPSDPIQINGVEFITKGLILKGTLTGAASDLNEMMRVVQRHQIIPEVDIAAFEEIPDLFSRCATGKVVGKLGAVIS